MKYMTLAVVAVLVMALSGCAPREGERGARGQLETETVTGTVVSRTAQALVLTTDDAERLSLQVDGRSQVSEDLRAGDRVEAHYESVNGASPRLLWARLDSDQAARGEEAFHGRDTVEGDVRRDAPSSGRAEHAVPGQPGADRRPIDQSDVDRTASSDQQRVDRTVPVDQQRAPVDQQRADRWDGTGRTDRGYLPGTASPLPLAGLAGLLALSAGLVLRRMGRRG